MIWLVSHRRQELIISFRGTKNRIQLLREARTSLRIGELYEIEDENGSARGENGEAQEGSSENAKNRRPRRVNRYFMAQHKHLWPTVQDVLKAHEVF